jgi:hypothetical protein
VSGLQFPTQFLAHIFSTQRLSQWIKVRPLSASRHRKKYSLAPICRTAIKTATRPKMKKATDYGCPAYS